jgi:PAS domain S-box-containing protein
MQRPSEEGAGAGWERLFWLAFDRTANPIALLDDERRFVAVNDAALALVERDRDDLLGTSMAENIRRSERPRAARDWESFLESGEYAGSRALVRADGSEVQIDFAARLAEVGGRRLAIYVAMAADWDAHAPSPEPPTELALTGREREIVTLIALGRETGEIAAELHISPETVRTHVRNAMAKLGARTRAQLVAVVLCSEHAVHAPHVEA